MNKKFLMLLAVPVTAFALVVDFDGQQKEVDRVDISQRDGRVVIRTTPKAGETPAPDPVPVPTPEPDPPVAGCTPVPGVVVVNTGSLDEQWKQRTISPSGPTTIYAFKFTTPSSTTVTASFTATKTSSARLTKGLVVSECPGSAEAYNGNLRGCTKFSTESSRMYLTTVPGAAERAWCVLKTNKTYYVNAFSHELRFSTPTCDSAFNCSFYAGRAVHNR